MSKNSSGGVERLRTMMMIVFATLLFSGSHALAFEKATLSNRAAATDSVTFGVYVPISNRGELEELLTQLHDQNSSMYRQWLSRSQFEARFRPDEAAVSRITEQLSGFNLTVTRSSSRHLLVSGKAADVERALATKLMNGKFQNGRSVVAATGGMTLPDSLSSAHATVSGLSGTNNMRHFSTPTGFHSLNRTGGTGPYWFDDLKQAYKWPSFQNLTGKGSTIAILIDSEFEQSDMDLYFGHEQLATPAISEVKVDGGSGISLAIFEAHLDIQQSGGMAPGANIMVYNVPALSNEEILAGLNQIITDNKADVVSMSFGEPEIEFSAPYNMGVDTSGFMTELDDLFAQGNAQGITFVAASGDSGAFPVLPIACFNNPTMPNCGTYQAGVDFPASSPHVTSVGGTNLVTTFSGDPNDLNSAYVSESAFADQEATDPLGTTATGVFFGSGGGDSFVFKKPSYQRLVNTGNPSFRTTPDVALHMGGEPATSNSNDSSDIEIIGGTQVDIVGTSASAPDFAGLIALLIEHLGGRIGNANPYIYTLAAAQQSGVLQGIFNQNIPGNNGLFKTGKGYNRVLGNGTVNGINFLLMPNAEPAGIPQTPTNP
jgi:kumamolisin